MILDNIKNSCYYESLNGRFKKAFEFLRNTDLLNLPAGKTAIDGDNIYAVVSEYQTKPNDNRYEKHNRYIDIQYIVRGNESIYFAQDSGNKADYDENKDVSLCQIEEGVQLNIPEGSFAVFFTGEWHRPNCIFKQAENVKKVVIKIKA